ADHDVDVGDAPASRPYRDRVAALHGQPGARQGIGDGSRNIGDPLAGKGLADADHPGQRHGHLSTGQTGGSQWLKAVVQSAPMRVALAFLLLLLSGCSAVNWPRPAPTPILPAQELYQIGENELGTRRYEGARTHLQALLDRH